MTNIDSRVVEIEYPNGDKRYIGELNYKRFWGLLDNWRDVTGECYTEERAKSKVRYKKWKYERRKNKKANVL